MSKHTSGPWEVHLGYDNTGYPCFYIHGMAGDQKRDIPVLTANARLIAAAPELLAVCQGVLSHPSFIACDCGKPDCATTVLRAAIAKATGEA